MIKVILGIALILLGLGGVLAFRTVIYPFAPPSMAHNGETMELPISEEALERLAGGIRIPTVSNVEYDKTNFAPFDAFKTYLAQSYPRIYAAMETHTINGYGLVFHWKGQNREALPLLFLSHYDVVPVINWDPSSPAAQGEKIFRPQDTVAPPLPEYHTYWEYPPFSGAVANGNIYGRGTLDMKSMLFAIMEAADSLLDEHFVPEQDIWLAFGHDEETGGREGAIPIARYLEEQGLRFAAVFDEGGLVNAPGSALDPVDRPLAVIGLGEKGFLSVGITVHGLGGHSSMPPPKGSLVLAAEIVHNLNENQLPARIIPPIQEFLGNVGSELPLAARAAIANQWLLKPLLMGSLAKAPASNALIRSTTAITGMRGSEATNVLASTAQIVVNFRLLPGDTVESVLEHVRRQCEGYTVDIEIIGAAREASALTPADSHGFEAISTLIHALYPEALVSPYITIGGTDAYKYQNLSNHIYRFMPILLNAHEQRTIHNENEHISIHNYAGMITFFKTLMQSYGHLSVLSQDLF